jgi:hypothetical protein
MQDANIAYINDGVVCGFRDGTNCSLEAKASKQAITMGWQRKKIPVCTEQLQCHLIRTVCRLGFGIHNRGTLFFEVVEEIKATKS